MALIRLHGVGKRFGQGIGGTIALEQMSLELQAGEFVSFLGPSGCGKSTALRLIAGLIAPTSGTIERAGSLEAGALGRARSTAANDPAASNQQRIGFVFQEPTLMPWASVTDNVSLPLRIAHRPAPEIAKRVSEALGLVGLSEFARAFPRELSGGMKMRVSIARAMVTQPTLLLMDEPFAALDEMTRIKLNNDVLALWRQHGLTVVFVTHSVYESVYLSQRIVVMAARPGRVIDDIAIDAPYPRDELFRTSADYGELCRKVSKSLQRSSGRVAADG